MGATEVLSPAEHSRRVYAAIESNDASAIVASWRRSAKRHHLDPAETAAPHRLTDWELWNARQRVAPLLAAAQASLDRLYRLAGGSGCCILLADARGIVVDRRGAAGDDEAFREWGLWQGADWSERREGANGVGTCLVEARALTVHRDQHFLARNAHLSCTAAPIYDQQGDLVGALGVASCRTELTGPMINLMVAVLRDAARAIEAVNFRFAYPNARIVVAPTRDGAPNALLAVNRDDMIIGATRLACASLGLKRQPSMKAAPAAEFLGGHATLSEELKRTERSVLERALVEMNGNATAAARALGISRATLHRKLKNLSVAAGC